MALGALVAVLLVGGWLAIDHLPRFFQGDSIAYLSIDADHLWPDRSWAFGLLVSALLRASRSHLCFLLLQAALLAGTTLACAALFPPGTARRLLFPLFVACVSLDPLLGLYLRFYMSDLLAFLLFTAFLLCLHAGLRAPARRFPGWWAAMAACLAAAVFARVAYAPVALLCLLGLGVGLLRARAAVRPRGPALRRLGLTLVLPPLALALLVGANAAVFAGRFPGEVFANKMSGVFLLGTFAPALQAEDFRAAGVAVSDAEVAALDLGNFHKRVRQIWGERGESAHALIRDRLGITEEYSATVDQVSGRILRHAAWRDPLAVARVYAVGLLIYFSPDEWTTFLQEEMGLSRDLPEGFVQRVNAMTDRPLDPGITGVVTPMLAAFLHLAPAYPLLLLCGSILAAWRLLSGRGDLAELVVSAGLLATVASVPLFSNYVIPRYVLAAVFLSHLLLVRACRRGAAA
ncbi:hypothetical protein [Roseomonas sp. BN140053]|uniref:hypothetical protein n=1 Tax=Roseomonas sp. BN140053 TaxID=3391898 RepID=UPI0039EC90A9